MKNYIVTLLIATAMFSSCQDKLPTTARLETSLDTLAYCLGRLNGADRATLGAHLQSIDSDSTHIEDFLSGLYAGISKGAEASTRGGNDKASIAFDDGINAGQSLLDRIVSRTERMMQLGDSLHLSVDEFAAGFADVVYGRQALAIGGKALTREQVSDLAMALTERISDERAEVLYGKEKRAGLDFIAQKAKEEGVKSLSNGIYYKEIQAGSGAVPTMQSQVNVRYEGRLINGKVFDSTANHGGKAFDTFSPERVIKGWQEALTHMPVGSKWEVYIPYDQAYGPAGNPPDIPPYATLIFTMELISFE